MEDRQLILEALENPEIIECTVSRRDALGSARTWGAGLALASMPFALAALTKRAFAQELLPVSIENSLNFALLLEYLEAEFYNLGLAADGLIPDAARDVFDQIREHENAHVAFLQAVLGSRAISKPAFDFTAGGAFPDVFTNYQTFLLLSQAFEDTGVRAYKGQAPNVAESDLVLSAALRIHSVEARHASQVRRLRGLEGWIPFDQPGAPAAAAPVYMGEGNTVHAGIDAATVTDESAEAVTEAFDEPLGVREVLAIAGQFLAR